MIQGQKNLDWGLDWAASSAYSGAAAEMDMEECHHALSSEKKMNILVNQYHPEGKGSASISFKQRDRPYTKFIVGVRTGLLVKKSETKWKHGKHGSLAIFECLCSNVVYLPNRHVYSGQCITCGSCQHRTHSEPLLFDLDRSLNLYLSKRFHRAKGRAKRRNIDFTIDKDSFCNLITGQCYYCETKHFNNGCVDRFNSNEGYSVKNCVSACYKCNTMKHDFSLEEFLEHIQKILKVQGYKNVFD